MGNKEIIKWSVFTEEKRQAVRLLQKWTDKDISLPPYNLAFAILEQAIKDLNIKNELERSNGEFERGDINIWLDLLGIDCEAMYGAFFRLNLLDRGKCRGIISTPNRAVYDNRFMNVGG